MLIPMIKNFVKEHWIWILSKRTGVSRQSVYNLLNNKNATFKKSTLDKLYSFFHLYKDEFYLQNLKRQYQDWHSYLARLLQDKRISMWLSRYDIVKGAIISEKTISRIERWWVPDIWTLEQILPILKFSVEESNVIIEFAKHLKVLADLQKKYSIIET